MTDFRAVRIVDVGDRLPERWPRGRLPRNWHRDLDPAVVAEVRTIERYTQAGHLLVSDPDARGYRWIRLCKGHPYASSTGWQRLHRYLLMRILGRRLDWFEHVHHTQGSAKDTIDPYHLELLEAIDHGIWHYGQRLRCGDHLTLWTPRDERGRFTKLPTPDSVRRALEDQTQ